MTEKKSGPVKPPTLDMKARTSTAADGTKKPDEKPGPAKPEVKTEAPKAAEPKSAPTAKSGTSTAALIAAGFGGGVIALGAAALISWAGYWPQKPAPATEPAASAAALNQLEARLSTLEEQAAQSARASLPDDVAALTDRVTNLENAPAPTGTPTDLAPLESQIADLSSRIAALESAPRATAGGQVLAPDLTPQIDALKSQLAALQQALDTTKSELTEATTAQSQRLDALEGNIASTQENAQARASAIQLFVALSGLETAINSGQSFGNELAVLTGALPDLPPPAALSASAIKGLPAPSNVKAELADKIPAMLAARPQAQSQDWTGALMDRAAALLAVRPTNDAGDNAPESLIARLEKSVADEDFATASETFAALPPAMQAEAQQLGTDLNNLAAAKAYIAEARAALSATQKDAS